MNAPPDIVQLQPETAPLPFLMATDSETEKRRALSWDYKEPETIAWIASFGPEDVFFDVGANVGVYSLYCAAMHLGARVHAFEPDRKNFRRLQENISRNGFGNIAALPFALCDHDGEEIFGEMSAETGSSGGQIGTWQPDQARYAVPARTLDTLCAEMGVTPTHVKIDIDGEEGRVVRGMEQTLQNPSLRSVLIELDRPGYSNVTSRVCRTFIAAGFTQQNRFNALPNHSRVRRAAEGILVENVVFTRR